MLTLTPDGQAALEATDRKRAHLDKVLMQGYDRERQRRAARAHRS